MTATSRDRVIVFAWLTAIVVGALILYVVIAAIALLVGSLFS